MHSRRHEPSRVPTGMGKFEESQGFSGKFDESPSIPSLHQWEVLSFTCVRQQVHLAPRQPWWLRWIRTEKASWALRTSATRVSGASQRGLSGLGTFASFARQGASLERVLCRDAERGAHCLPPFGKTFGLIVRPSQTVCIGVPLFDSNPQEMFFLVCPIRAWFIFVRVEEHLSSSTPSTAPSSLRGSLSRRRLLLACG